MTISSLDTLTQRQAEIVRLVALRTPVKVIAQELGIAPSTVNDHIVAAKRKLHVDSTRQLAEVFLASAVASQTDTPQDGGALKNRVVESSIATETSPRDKPAFSFHDSMASRTFDDWYIREPTVVPEALDGDTATLARLVAIAKIIALIFASVVLAGTAMVAIEMAFVANEPASEIESSSDEPDDISGNDI